MNRSTSRTSIEMQSDSNGNPPPPPPYTSVVYKLSEPSGWDNYPPPSYTDLEQLSNTNNYPGPPLTDGCVQIDSADSTVNSGELLSKKVRVFLAINGLITLLLGLAAFGFQTALIVTKSVLYYYYGYWAGALILSVALNIFIVIHHSRRVDLKRLLRSFLWQMIFMLVVFAIGVVILATDRCNDNGTDDDDGNGNQTVKDPSCRSMNKILMGGAIGVVGATILPILLNALSVRSVQRSFLPTRNVFSQNPQ